MINNDGTCPGSTEHKRHENLRWRRVCPACSYRRRVLRLHCASPPRLVGWVARRAVLGERERVLVSPTPARLPYLSCGHKCHVATTTFLAPQLPCLHTHTHTQSLTPDLSCPIPVRLYLSSLSPPVTLITHLPHLHLTVKSNYKLTKTVQY